jgi:hypothetical protein
VGKKVRWMAVEKAIFRVKRSRRMMRTAVISCAGRREAVRVPRISKHQSATVTKSVQLRLSVAKTTLWLKQDLLW